MKNFSELQIDLELNMNDIAFTNIQKILNRKEHGTISGNGDNR